MYYKRFLFVSVCLLFLTACNKDEICKKGKGAVEKREIPLSPFIAIELEGSGHVFVTEAEVQKVEVETNGNLFERLNTNVENGLWKVNFRHCVRKYTAFNVYITVPSLSSVKLSGSGSISGTNTLNSSSLNVGVSGSGKITLALNASAVNCVISGSGNITLTGKADSQTIDVSGSGTVHNFNLETGSASVKISGSGNSYVHTITTLNAAISGNGNVYYIGSPQISSSISGSGNIKNSN